MVLKLHCMLAVFFSQETNAAAMQEISTNFEKIAFEPSFCGYEEDCKI